MNLWFSANELESFAARIGPKMNQNVFGYSPISTCFNLTRSNQFQILYLEQWARKRVPYKDLKFNSQCLNVAQLAHMLSSSKHYRCHSLMFVICLITYLSNHFALDEYVSCMTRPLVGSLCYIHLLLVKWWWHLLQSDRVNWFLGNNIN